MSVSIIMKTLNEEKRIAAAIESALAALSQDVEKGKSEIIVADSGSTDRTIEIASQYPVTVVQIEAPAKPSCGIGPQLGFQYSHNEFICLMDGDMLLDKDFLAAAIAFLKANPRAAGVTGHVVEMNVDNLEFTRRVRRVSPENRIGPLDRMNGGGLYRRSAIEEAGYFSDRNLHGYEEFDLGVRLRALGWSLHRLDRRFVSHFGHSINAYKLLVKRWQSKYLRGVGELLRAAWGKPYWNNLLKELPELRLWAGVYAWWLAMLALLVFLPDKKWAIAIDLAAIIFVIAIMSLKQRSLPLGFYAVVAWCFHAAALPLGFFHPRRAPDARIESRVISKPR
ncbi:glycosyltransferase [Phyllobacterium salinisoli]|uniref:Glycosyltransferase n=1 Tax=Phyllobacterium salinisoli TaxID=1899321 RepID=A0A368K717_9HYPH|nr:glycosyltransferase [Phyllobacterium salinisoli]RCS25156.1 glycosyltransferase [Phyllobacterium salinisoli]